MGVPAVGFVHSLLLFIFFLELHTFKIPNFRPRCTIPYIEKYGPAVYKCKFADLREWEL